MKHLRFLNCRLVALAFASALLFSSPASAQVFRIRQIGFDWLNHGGPGNTIIIGTGESDQLADIHRNDRDSLHDAPGGPDGKPDDLDTGDGDGLDTMWGGIEDTFFGDPDDKVNILIPGGTEPFWCGKYREYARIRAVIRWIRDQLQLRAPVPGAMGGLDLAAWSDLVEAVADELAGFSPFLGQPAGATLEFDQLFTIGPYIFGDVIESPLDCLHWAPYRTKNDPVASTDDLTFTESEYNDVVATALLLMDHLRDQISEL